MAAHGQPGSRLPADLEEPYRALAQLLRLARAAGPLGRSGTDNAVTGTAPTMTSTEPYSAR